MAYGVVKIEVQTKMRTNEVARSSDFARHSPTSSMLHKGFVYLDDEIVTNSLPAIAARKIDEVVARINSAQDSTIDAGGGGTCG